MKYLKVIILSVSVFVFSQGCSKHDLLLKTLKGHNDKVQSVTYSLDGKYIASGSNDKTIKIWEASSGICIKTINEHEIVSSVVFSPDGKCVASECSDDKMKIWEVSSGDCMRTLEGHIDSVNSLSYSPDGKCIVSGSDDKTVKIWENPVH